MKRDKTIEQWFKDRNDNELSMLHTLIKDEQTKNTFLLSAFRWTVNECVELSDLKVPISSTDTSEYLNSKSKEVDAQMECISRYRESGVCVRCKEPLSGVIREAKKKNNKDVYLADYLFLSVHQSSGLCTNCIGEFLLQFITKFSSGR